MADDIKELIESTSQDMQKAIDAMEHDFRAFRTGRASTAMVEKLQVDYYGSHVALQTLAALSVPEAQQILIRPFDAGSVKLIEKAIAESDLKITPQSDGKVIRLNMPPLTTERRKDLVKQAGKRLEECRISIRNARRDGMEMLEAYESDKVITEDALDRGKEELEKVTKSFTEKADTSAKRKEEEIMKI
jgi:ribosome recycling factor